MPYPLGHRGYIGPLFIIQVINIAFNVMKITGNISTISYRIAFNFIKIVGNISTINHGTISGGTPISTISCRYYIQCYFNNQSSQHFIGQYNPCLSYKFQQQVVDGINQGATSDGT